MGYKERYINYKKELLNDGTICKENRDLFKEFLKLEEYKLKRSNGLTNLDEATYKTLYNYLLKLRNVNNWFKNKPWKNLIKEDIKKVYDALEDGRIKNKNGQKYGDLGGCYYRKIFKGKPFEMAGKKELAKEVMQFHKDKPKEDVRFITEESFRKIVDVAIRPEHKLLMWLAFDVGENINTLLNLTKKDFFREVNEENKEVEYRVNLPKDKLKRSRQTRSEITNFKETTEFLDIVLANLKENDKLFEFGHRQASKILKRAANIVKAKCIPKNESITWKDLRSSMSCYLLSKGWTTDEINKRLGHAPSSRQIDRYVNFMASDKHRPKQKLIDSDIRKVRFELEEIKDREKLKDKRLAEMTEKFKSVEEVSPDIKEMIIACKKLINTDKESSNKFIKIITQNKSFMNRNKWVIKKEENE